MQLLRRGDCGPAVREIRTTLGQLGLLPAVPPGSRAQDMFDDGVDRAVRMFQQGRGLITDGIVGPDTARALREAGCTARVVGLTGNVVGHDRRDFLSAGADDVLGKPVQRGDLMKALFRPGQG